MATTSQILQLLYITYYGRPADVPGIDYWLNTNPDFTITQFGSAFAGSGEFKRLNNDAKGDISAVINSYYQNLFDREAESEGLAYWTKQVLTGVYTLEEVGIVIATSADAADSAVRDKKVAAAELWTTTARTTPGGVVNYPNSTDTFIPFLQFDNGRAFLDGVGKTKPDPTPAETTAAILAIPPIAQSFVVAIDTATVSEGGTVKLSVEDISTTLQPYPLPRTFTVLISGVLAADIANQPLAFQITTDDFGKFTVPITIAADALIEGTENMVITVQNGAVSLSSTVQVIDVPPTPPTPPNQFILTTSQDIEAGAAVPVFTFKGNEATLGQGDELSRGDADQAVLQVAVSGDFDLNNFSTFGVQTLRINGDGVATGLASSVAMSNTDIANIEVIRALQSSVLFDDIQTGALNALIKDSYGDYEFNFDVSALLGFDDVDVVLDEIPVDQQGAGVGLFLTQGPAGNPASVEQLEITSINTSGSPLTNLVNVITEISVGPELENLNFLGTTSVEVQEDLGLNNAFITSINAEQLDADLSLAYTTSVQDSTPDNTDPDVVVIGAQGDNDLILASTGVLPADFSVVTFDGDDAVSTTIGDDTISVGAGDNIVDAGEGVNVVTALDGDNEVTTGSGNDSVVLGNGDNLVNVGAGDNIVFVGNGDNQVTALDGDDEIRAGIGSNFIDAGAGDNFVRAGALEDGTPLAAGGNKVITLGGDDDIATGNGNDEIASGDGDDLIRSGDGADLVVAGNGDNQIFAGAGDDNVAIGNGDDTVDMGPGKDTVWMQANNLTVDDLIDGGEGIEDAILFTAGGVVDQSDSSGVFNVEQFTLTNVLGLDPDEIAALLASVTDHEFVQGELARILAGAQADYDITLGTDLVSGSDNLDGNVRRFTVDATGALADVVVDTSEVAIRGADRNFLAVSYLGSSAGYNERLIVSEASLSSRLFADFDNFGESFGDVLELLGNATGKTAINATVNDLSGVSNVDVIELNTLSNVGQDFFITLDQAFINRNASNADPLFIRATNGLPAGSRLFLDVSAVTSAGETRSIVVEKTSNLTVNVIGDSALGTDAAKVQVVDAFFFTPNADDINGTTRDDLFISDSLANLQSADNLDGGNGFDTLLLEFPVNDADLEFEPLFTPEVFVLGQQQLDPELTSTTGWVSLLGQVPYVGGFDFMGGIPMLGGLLNDFAPTGFTFEDLPILDGVVTQVTNLLTTPVPVDPSTFPGLIVDGEFVSPSLPDLVGIAGLPMAALPFPSFVDPRGQTLESQLNFVDVENVEKYQFNPPNDDGVRFVGFNSDETFETPGFFEGDLADLQLGQLDLVSLEILQTFDTSRNPNAGNGNAIIEGPGAPLNDILFLDDFSWNTSVTTEAEDYWDNIAQDTYQVSVANFAPVGFQAVDNNVFIDGAFDSYGTFGRYVADPAVNDFGYGSFFDSDVDSEAHQQRRSADSNALDFALEVDTGAGNDYIWRGTFGPSGVPFQEVGEVTAQSEYLAGYLVDTGSGDDIVTLDATWFLQDLDTVANLGLFGGYNFVDASGGAINIFDVSGNNFYNADGKPLASTWWDDNFNGFDYNQLATAYADDVILTRSGNDFVVDFGGDNIVYSGIGNDYVLTGYGNDFIISDEEDQTLLDPAASASGGEVIAGPGATNDTDNDIVLADGPLVGSFLQFSPEFNQDPSGVFFLLGQASPGVFGQDYVRDLSGDNIISTGGNDDTVVTGLGDDIVLAGTLGDLSGEDGSALYNDSDVINDLGGHNLIVTLGDDDYIEDGDGSSVILAGFGNDNDVVFANGDADFIEIAGGDDYVDAGAGDDFIASLLGAGVDGPNNNLLSLQTGDWDGLSTGDTLLGGAGFDTYLTAFGGSQDDVVIAPRLVLTSNADGVPTTVSSAPNPGSYPASYDDALNGDGSVNPIMDSIETLILFSDDADIYLTDTVARQAKNKVDGLDQVTVFLNDLEYTGGTNIVLNASAFEATSSLRAFAFNIGAESLQDGIDGLAGLIGGSGVDFLAAGSFLEEGILAGGTDIATLLTRIGSFLDNQALDNFVGLDISEILTEALGDFGLSAANVLQAIFPSYADPTNSVEDIQAGLNLIFSLLEGDFVEDYITYQGNGGGDFITLEPTVLLPDGAPIVPENTVEFVRYETIRDGAKAGIASGFDQVFNFNNTDTNLPFANFDASGNIQTEGTITNSFNITTATTVRSTAIATSKADGVITGDKIVFGGGVGQVADIISKNGNQLVDLFKVNAAVNWNSGRTTNVLDGSGNVAGQYKSGDEALFVDAGIQVTNDQITNFGEILGQINSFGTVADLNQGGLIVVNGGDKAIYAVYQELDGDLTNIAQNEVSILGLVQGIDTNSFRLQASDFIIDNGFISYTSGVTEAIGSQAAGTTPDLPTAGNIWDAQPVTDATKPPFANAFYTGTVTPI